MFSVFKPYNTSETTKPKLWHEVKKYFNTQESRFGFLPSVDCNGEQAVKESCDRFEATRQDDNAIRKAIIEDIFAPETEEYDYEFWIQQLS